MAADGKGTSPQNPFLLDDAAGYTWLKGNVHTHTTNSDGQATPQERVDQYAARGYDFLAITDHGKITRVDSLHAPDGLTLIQGAELHPSNPFGGQVHHFVALGIDADIDASKMAPQHVIDAVREQGGSVWLAHPYWCSVNMMRDVLPLHGLAGMEVFNSICHCYGRGESAVHWNDWMEQSGRLLPALATDDAHAVETAESDTYGGWTMVRVKERDAATIRSALEQGLSYSSTGPQIHDIQLRRLEDDDKGNRVIQATVRCSEAQRIQVIYQVVGAHYREPGRTFEEATFNIGANASWARFEIIAPDGAKAWSNPFDLEQVQGA
jgi:hypothetical protein